MLLNGVKCQRYSLYRLWVIKEKPTVVGVVKLPPPQAHTHTHTNTHPHRLGLTVDWQSCWLTGF